MTHGASATCPTGRKALQARWVFRVKQNKDGGVDKYKARLVVKGFQQVSGVDYDDTFAPVARMTAIRTLLAYGANWIKASSTPIHHMDVCTAFLNGALEEDIYMEPPDGITVPAGKVLRLKKALYGLKQAPRVWNATLHAFLSGIGMTRGNADNCIYVRRNSKGDVTAVVAVYVDDLLIFGRTNAVVNTLKKAFSSSALKSLI